MFGHNLRILLILMGLANVAQGATPYKKSLNHVPLTHSASLKKNNRYLADGVFVGGEAGSGSSLLGVRRSFSAKAELERVILDMGDALGETKTKKLGYFQVAVERRMSRAVIDLAQLKYSRVSEAKLREAFKKSPFVSSVDFSLDPADTAGSLVLNFKKPMVVEVFQLRTAGQPARIIVDLRPVTPAS